MAAVCLAFFAITGIVQGAVAAPTVVVNGKTLAFDVPPVIESGRTLVPLRAIFEALGAAVQWDATTRTVTATRSSTTIQLAIGQAQAQRNGQPVTLDVPARIQAGRTLVPLRFVSEALGAKVTWEAATQTVTISMYPTLPVYNQQGQLLGEYTGPLRDGLPHGYGTLKLADGTTYVGEFVAGKYQGSGTLTRSDGVVQEGTWADNRLVNGTHTLTLANGTRARQQVRNGELYGPITLLYPDGRTYSGGLAGTVPQGQGTMTFPDGGRYVGEFVQGEPEGQGTYTYANGNRYQGEFKDGKANGQGTFVYANGATYVGQFVDGVPNGQGTLTRPDGTRVSGTWKDGKLVEQSGS
jgi:hypothetical protein